MAVSNSLKGPELIIRCPRIRPRDSPIFKAVKVGDVLCVRNLLINGEASVLDADEEGMSVLSWSTSSFRRFSSVKSRLKYKEVIELLLQLGADIFQTDMYMR